MGMRVRVGNTNTAILRGDMDLSVWSEEELIRGQRRAKDGRWTGRPPAVVPKAIHDELVKRRMSKAGEMLRDSLVDAVELLRQVILDDDAQYSDRIKAAQLVMERVMGKSPERVEIAVEPPWATALRHALVDVDVVGTVIDVDSYTNEDDA